MEGSCACGSVTYHSGNVIQFVNCHCNLCRRINGAAFSSYVVVKADTLEISDSGSLSGHTVSERTTKYFCTKCGTPLYNSNPGTYPGLAMLYLGTLANAAEIAPGINIFCSSKLDWVDQLTAQRSFSEAPHRGA
jgi:hypothetical protein